MRGWIAWAMVALLVFCSCGNKTKVKTPELLLTEEQMIDVLTDSYLIEAELNYRKSSGEDVKDLQTAYYQQFFEHYGITDSIFSHNLEYYSYQPSVLERIMDSVTNRFEKMRN